MEKSINFVVLLLLLLCWAAVFDGVPGLQGLLTIVSICGVALGMRCKCKPAGGQ